MRTITIDPTFDAWRSAARALLAEGVPPESVVWTDTRSGGSALPFAAAPIQVASSPQAAERRVSARFIESSRFVSCFRDEARWALMYRILWRLMHGQPHLLDVLVDDDVHRFHAMERAVRHDRHKMTAFVRFRRIATDEGEPHYVAWHRPDHYIVRLAAPFFADRFGSMHWSILTPDESMSWDGHQLCFGEGVPARMAPRADALEALWRTYYANIFNPARVNISAMRRHMPRRHWATLPEMHDLPQLLRQAPARVEAMMKRSAVTAKTSCPSTGSAADFLPAKLSLPQLRQAVQECRGCELYCNATQAVFGGGPTDARIMFVGEQPGDQEDLAGKPFVGPSGQLLDEMMQQAGIPRGEVYVTNAVKHFKFEPRGKRRIHAKPSAREVAACRPWLEAEIELIKPPMIVTLGATAAQSLLGSAFRLTQHRHEVITTSPHAPWLLATVHPSALLRMPDAAAREQARRDFLADMRLIARQLNLKAAGDPLPRATRQHASGAPRTSGASRASSASRAAR